MNKLKIKGVVFDNVATICNSEDHLTSLAKLRIQKVCSLLSDQGLSFNQTKRSHCLVSV